MENLYCLFSFCHEILLSTGKHSPASSTDQQLGCSASLRSDTMPQAWHSCHRVLYWPVLSQTCLYSWLEFHMAPDCLPPSSTSLQLETHRTCHCPNIFTTPSQQYCFVHKNPCSSDVQALLLALLDPRLQTSYLQEQPGPLKWSRSGWTSSSHHPTTLNVHVVKAQHTSTTQPAFPGDAIQEEQGVCTRLSVHKLFWMQQAT